MITKKRLLADIQDLTAWCNSLERRVYELSRKMPEQKKEEKRLKKAIKSVTNQPRTKDGKFAKKA